MNKILFNIALSVAMIAVFGSIYAIMALIYLWRIGAL